MLKFLFKTPVVPVFWTLMIQVLLCLPGSAIPQSSWLDAIHIDKIVHVILFGGLVVTWALFLNRNRFFSNQLTKFLLILFLFSTANGILLEFVQKYYIPNRSFDLYDIMADACGAAAGFLFSFIYFSKSRSI
ncbi:VanZ family protein [Pinibacter soli]|uniref:VanZ family protein n=1 Tax=Pinibacter soli TaxID=3044211 RepID=A0ABT6RCH3_9BACT|nr:VanZ family protein [Pinibacter soli]MDI3320269.1 VanZ family protein [Pinibacter soli]